MDFRMYVNALGRFHNIDKMTDIMPSLSPYRFAFNNPILWSDPTGLLEEDGGGKKKDETLTIHLDEAFIIGKAKNKRPENLNYSLINWSQVDNRRRPTLEQYNKHNGTNYASFDDYYYNEHYKPAQNKMIQKRNQAGKTVIGTLLVMGTAGVGTAYALPVLVACSPAIQSTVATLVTNPSIQQIALNAGSQYFANGRVAVDINIIEAGLSGVPGTNLIPTIVGETFSYTPNNFIKNESIKNSFGSNKWYIQAGGGVLSNRFGKATGSFLDSEGVQGKVAGEYFKFIIERGSNAAPNLIED